MKNNKIQLHKVYESKTVEGQPEIRFDQSNKKRPSWVKLELDKKVIFIKILFNDEAFWYRRYFRDYFFPLESTSEDYKNYYNEIAQNYENFIPQNKKMRQIILDFLKELGIKKDSSILDLGAGTGIVTEGIAKEGYNNLTLLDLSKKELEIAKKKKELKNASYIECDLTKDEIKGKYDVIFATMSLDYFKGEQLFKILEKIKNALNEGGKLIVIDRHIYPEFNKFFKEIKSGKIGLETPEGLFDYYYFVGKK